MALVLIRAACCHAALMDLICLPWGRGDGNRF